MIGVLMPVALSVFDFDISRYFFVMAGRPVPDTGQIKHYDNFYENPRLSRGGISREGDAVCF